MMIVVTSRGLVDDGAKVVVNEALIESIKPFEGGGCTIRMASGAIIVARESARTVVAQIGADMGFYADSKQIPE